MASRIDNYRGSESEYTAYLEECVRQCRRQHSTCHTIDSYHSIDSYRSELRSGTKRGIEFIEVTFQEPSKKRCTKPSLAIQNLSKERCAKPSRAIQELPKELSKERRAKPSRAIQAPKWKSVAEELVGETPSAAEWTDKLRELEISSEDALSFLLSSSQGPTETADPKNTILTSIPSTSNVSLIDRVEALAYATAQHGARAVSALRLANLAQFIILSTCLVLLEEKEGKREDVFTIVRICVGKEITERYIVMLLRTVRFINESIDVFDAHGWRNRGSHLLLIWNRPVATYVPLVWTPEASLTYLRDKLCATRFTDGPPIVMLPLFVPSVVHSLLEKKIHVARIGHILGYQHAGLLRDGLVNPWQYFNRG